MAAITWSISGGRVVETVGEGANAQFRLTDISIEDYNAGRLPYGQIVGEPYELVRHQDTLTNVTDVWTVPWIEEVYKGEPLPGIQPNGDVRYNEDVVLQTGPSGTPIGGAYQLRGVGPYYTPLGGSAPATPTGVGVDTATGGPKPLAVIGPRDEFIGGRQGEIRVVGPGPLVGESDGIRFGHLPRIVLRDQLGE